ncbi:putative subunit of DNA replication factor C (RF-C) [Blyttiomyces helicus]|uniref:Replication factor C subunit 5 n=1 Tax=Blyttiomyces helicus TaxID=388810 RepID=A0A4P9W662_9FUNG|nr:putative subunit of DNA replication factor C (RF-C) [Blyttiomyces helicus]|eukprot:RKO87462.1 putative subunit of DNA replication factor C (RF-C) [Blyttiomyces helicus]
MSLWVDRYRPASLDDLTYHEKLTDQLKRLAESGEFPHLLVYGPPGAGKKTRVVSVLRELYGPGVEKLKIDLREFVTPSGKKLEINVVSSNYHLEMTPSDVGIYDRVVIQDLIKEIAQTQQVDSNAKRAFKVVVFNEADSLSRDAQAALRRTMEKYMGNLRVILCCESSSKIISPIRSRCLLVRVASPSMEEVCAVLEKIAVKQGFDLPAPLARRIADFAGGNLRKAVLSLEALHVQNGNRSPLTSDLEPTLTDWEVFIRDLATLILGEQTPARLAMVRGKLYELLTHCIPASIVLKTLAFELIRNVDGQLKPAIVADAAEFEHRLRIGSKAIFHLEAFVARFMSVYKGYLIEVSGM